MTEITTTSVMNEIKNILDDDYSFATKIKQYILLQIAISKNSGDRAERKLKIVALLNSPFHEHETLKSLQKEAINKYRITKNG